MQLLPLSFRLGVMSVTVTPSKPAPRCFRANLLLSCGWFSTAWFLSLRTLLPRLRTDRRCRCLRHLQIRNDSAAPPLGSTVAGPRVSSNHRPGERASSGSSVVNMWKRFQMPAHSRKGPQRPIAVACAPLVGRRRSESPDAARWGRRRLGHLTSPDRRGAMLGPSPAAVGFGPARCLRPRRRCTRGRLARQAGRFAGSAPLLLTPMLTPTRITALVVAGQLSTKQLFQLSF
jgi:hypothetical protein